MAVSVAWLALLLALLLQTGHCKLRSPAHAPRSRAHKLDCRVSRQKVVLGASGSDEGGALIIGANVANNKANEDQWKFLFSKKMSHMWKVFVEPFPEYFSQLEISIRKNKVANATAVHAAIIPQTFSIWDKDTATAGGGSISDSPSVELFCHFSMTTHSSGKISDMHNISSSASSNTPSHAPSTPKRIICSLTSLHPELKHPFSSSSTTASGSASSSDARGEWRVTVPAKTLADLEKSFPVPDGTRTGHSGSKSSILSPIRFLVLDTEEMDFQLLQEVSALTEHSPLHRPSVISVNYGSFTQEQFDTSLAMLHQRQYMTCVAKKRKGHYLHAFHQPALLKLKGVQFL